MEASEEDSAQGQARSKMRPLLERRPGSCRIQGSEVSRLDIALLAEVKEFRHFGGMMYNHNTIDRPDLLFAVVYQNTAHEIVRCGSWVQGRPKRVSDFFWLHMKVNEAKELVPWKDLTMKGIKREEMLRIQRPLLC
ncbi:uncharacterized protein N7443_001781 [Penicillium atrosanguineum]|uniref:Uncharacterized protein n=1 Tax=Penicillium atrosanguineum TaxID=1132637 RepID=A0A9W9U576_9EURO|nr:uncharacterized protein N7443_001781 [Penicillium atrosanguineum]KAJ5117875.1 hypothetical protein N7526_010898 [Penicillium atrosanguineum]KAJ5309320.1 hypothetical protein N7443_001781 [Penicillium atrosanguineum]KAJ5318583.1 hypothetical protein N7476_005003 [Penicillium atrosanguineum]